MDKNIFEKTAIGTEPVCDCFNDKFLSMSNYGETATGRPKLLLHSCCGPCSTSVIETLISDYNITVFFYNPNITDREEYEKRKKNQLLFIKKYNEGANAYDQIAFVEGPYDVESYLDAIVGFEGEPEGGARCEICFRMRLEKTAEMARRLGCDYFATTLTVSPHKNYNIISMIGTEIALIKELSYLDIDFKKKGGYQRSIELSKQYALYRQNYCGCRF